MILSCSNISKAFGTDSILKHVSFHIEEREKAAIVGINGAGKSTLLKIIVGELAPDEGSVVIAKGKTLGYLAQHQDLESGRTIYDELLEVKRPIIEMEERLRTLEINMKRSQGEELESLYQTYSRLSHEFELANGYAWKSEITGEERLRTLEINMKRSQGEELESLYQTYSRLSHEFELANGYAWKSEITGVLKGLGFLEEEFSKPVATLSGGQKTRVSLGKLLLSKPDIILLDEPTNHLDMESIAWLENYLLNYQGTVIIVAHDRYFLDRVVTKVVELDNGASTVFQGNYSAYSDKKAMLRASILKAYLNQQQEIKHQEEVITKLRSFNREKSIKRAESREKLLNKIERIEKPTEINDAMNITLEPDIVSGNDVLTVRGLTKGFDGQTLFSDVDFDIKRGERIAIIGNNGTGKTTILKIINGILAADSGEIHLGSKVHVGYYDQEHHVLHNEKTLFQELSDTYPNMNNTQIRNVLAAFLFTGDDVFKLISDLSGGEKGRVSLAKLMLSEANFLILDEPTNHLDITSKEILENALTHYTGTVLYVSHDRYFINKTATRILDLTHNTLVNYIGNYDYYLEKRDTMEQLFSSGSAASSKPAESSSQAGSFTASGSVNASSLPWSGDRGHASSSDSGDSSGKTDWKQQKEEQARLRKRQNELNKTEDAIHQLETRDSEIDSLLCREDIFSDVAKLMELNAEKQSIAAQLEELYEKWEELAED